MKHEHKDFLGNPLSVGDEVVAKVRVRSGSSSHRDELVSTVVEGFTPARVRLMSGNGRLVDPHAVVKKPTQSLNPNGTPQTSRWFEQVLSYLAAGDAVTLLPQGHLLTTKQAAEFLNVSRPFLVKEYLLKGKLRFTEVGTHRKIDFNDLKDFQAKLRGQSVKAMDQMVELSQELGAGY